MDNMKSKIIHKDSNTTTWQTQAFKFTTNDTETVEIYLPEFSTTKIVTWKCHINESIESRYDIILGRD